VTNDVPGDRPVIVCLLPVRNAAMDLPGWFTSVRRFADAVVALDDGSCDDTAAVLAGEPLVRILLSNPWRETYAGWDDGMNRRRLLEAAAVLHPRWIFFLDADERLDEVDGHRLRAFVEGDAIEGFAYGFSVVRMVGDDATCDASSALCVYRLFAFERDQRLPDRRLHFVPVPTSVPRERWVETTLRIQHLGGSTSERRAARHAKYEEADPQCEWQADYSHLLDVPASVQRWQPSAPGLPVLLPRPTDQAIEVAPDGPVLSVIVISHDDEDTIGSSVRAVVEQKVPEPFEVIVVTSGTDRTAEIVRRDFPHVTVLALGRTALPGRARNAGLRVATGEYVSFPGSHVEILPGSLAARIAAHDKGYAMVTGTTLNGNPTPAGTAAYFLDNSASLAGRPSCELAGPPAHCSYRTDVLKAIGGFPEDLRAGEDTVVNRELWRRGHTAVRARDVLLTHRSPCRSAPSLVAHYFVRGRAMGRLITLEAHRGEGRPHTRPVVRVLRYASGRLRAIDSNVRAWGDHDTVARYRAVRPLVVTAVLAEWLAMWWELLRRPWCRQAPLANAGLESPVADPADRVAGSAWTGEDREGPNPLPT
jgi:glycosyltransferase involved in cell wall biosynthesis